MEEKMKRYVVVIDAYVYARDDQDAKEIAAKYAKYLDNFMGYEDNKAAVTGLYEMPFGALSARKIG